jgi:hypothetical protein
MQDTYIVKYSSFGDLLWSKVLATNANDFQGDLCIDLLDNLYVLIWTNGTFYDYGNECSVLIKMDSAGNVTALESFGGNFCANDNKLSTVRHPGSCHLGKRSNIVVHEFLDRSIYVTEWAYPPCPGHDVPPEFGTLGTCADVESLANGDACQPECGPGYTISGPTTCYAGVLQRPTCIKDCEGNVEPANGSWGTCAADGTLAGGASCRPQCSSGYIIAGSTDCIDGSLVLATCEPMGCGNNNRMESSVSVTREDFSRIMVSASRNAMTGIH